MNLVPDWTFVPMWFVFVATFFVLNTLVFKPTLQILAERRKRTEGSDKEVRHFNEQTQIKLKEYESILQEARNVAREARDGMIRQADAQHKQIVAEARKAAEQSLKVAKQQIQTESQTAKTELKSNVESIADSIKNKVMQRKVA